MLKKVTTPRNMSGNHLPEPMISREAIGLFLLALRSG